MKDPYEVLRQKEADLARLRHEIESLQLVASLVSDDETSDELEGECNRKQTRVQQAPCNHQPCALRRPRRAQRNLRSGNSTKGHMMWFINYKGMTLQQVLIMAYMNALEGRTDDRGGELMMSYTWTPCVHEQFIH